MNFTPKQLSDIYSRLKDIEDIVKVLQNRTEAQNRTILELSKND